MQHERVAASSDSLVDDLERLEGLRASGALTDEEFEVVKRRLLAD